MAPKSKYTDPQARARPYVRRKTARRTPLARWAHRPPPAHGACIRRAVSPKASGMDGPSRHQRKYVEHFPAASLPIGGSGYKPGLPQVCRRRVKIGRPARVLNILLLRYHSRVASSTLRCLRLGCRQRSLSVWSSVVLLLRPVLSQVHRVGLVCVIMSSDVFSSTARGSPSVQAGVCVQRSLHQSVEGRGLE